jgi:dTMP kinase
MFDARTGGTIEAESIRALLLNGAASKWQPATEAMMMSASRHEHVIHVIKPALSRGDIVICDRFTDSTHVYQGYVGGVDNALLDGLDQLSCQGLVPDLTLLLDMDSNAGLARTIQRGNAESRFESKGTAFHQKCGRVLLNVPKNTPTVLPRLMRQDRPTR